MSDDERGKKRKVPPSPRYVVRACPSPAQRLHTAARQRVESRRQALLALGLSDTEGVEDVFAWPLDAGQRRKRAARARLQTPAAGVGGGRRRVRRREPVARGGWFYEGSFEFECESKSSDALRARKAAVARLLKRVSLLAPPVARAPTPAPTPPPRPPAASAPPEAAATVGGEPAKDGERKKGKKKKKKKKSVLANEGNPHHIDKYRPSRLPNYSWHSSVLFPPSLAFLSTRNRYPVRENEYVCVQCQVALYYSTEARRKEALTARFRQLARYDPKLRRRRRKGPCTARRDGEGYDDEEYDDEDYDDEEGEEYEDEGYDGEEEGMGGQGGGVRRGNKCTCCLEPP